MTFRKRIGLFLSSLAVKKVTVANKKNKHCVLDNIWYVNLYPHCGLRLYCFMRLG